MNTVQNSSSSDFYLLLKIKNDDLKPYPYSSLINTVFDISNEIWEDQDLKKFPDHSVEKHSKNILKYFLNFDSFYNWTDIEKVVFSVSCMIHDIGMQYRLWSNKEIYKIYDCFPDPGQITDEEIRINHCKLGWNLIDIQLHKEYKLDYPPRFCINNEWHEDILNIASDIAFSHSTNSEILPEMIKKYRNGKRVMLSQDIRPLLLIAMMILCDELDGNCQRIENPQKIDMSYMDDNSQKYWLANIFVNQVNPIEKDLTPSKGFEIQVQVLLPINIEDDKKEVIKQFIKLYRIEKIRSEIERIQKILSTDTIPNASFPIYACKELIDQGETTHFKLDNKKWEIIKHSIEIKQPKKNEQLVEIETDNSGSNEIINAEDHKNIPSIKNEQLVEIKTDNSDLKEIINTEDYIDFPEIKTDIGKALIEWFLKNVNKDHYLLNNGIHTNYLVNCRSLIGNQELLNLIAVHIKTIYSDMKIDNILAIGTSAIPIAVNTAVRLNTDITFTMAKEKTGPINPQLNSGYTPLEVIPITSSGENLLIIDDIISSGKILNNIIKKFNLQKDYKKVYHFALFKLGKQKIEIDRKIDSKYILEIPFVEYYSSKDVCPMCQNKEDLKPENSIGY